MLWQNRKDFWAYIFGGLTILAGIILTVVSALKLCSSSCNDAHNYRLFGLPFEAIGALFFGILALFHLLSLKYPLFLKLNLLLVAGGIGAELYLIYLQESQIGSFCPVCLAIASTLFILGITYLYREASMWNWKRISLIALALSIGTLSTFFGVTKIDQLQAVEDQIKEKIKFGNPSSNIEIYVFTDWACPACRLVEPEIEKVGPKLLNEVRITFVDTVVHPETLNYAPYNLAFMVHNKPQYFRIRDVLNKLSLTTKKPNDQDISKAVAPLGVHYHELPYGDVSMALKYFEGLVDKYKITATPTVAIINPKTKKGKKLSGVQEVTEANIQKAIDAIR